MYLPKTYLNKILAGAICLGTLCSTEAYAGHPLGWSKMAPEQRQTHRQNKYKASKPEDQKFIEFVASSYKPTTQTTSTTQTYSTSEAIKPTWDSIAGEGSKKGEGFLELYLRAIKSVLKIKPHEESK